MHPPCKVPNLFCTRLCTGKSHTIRPDVELVIFSPYRAVVSKSPVLSGRNWSVCQLVRSVKKLTARVGEPIAVQCSALKDTAGLTTTDQVFSVCSVNCLMASKIVCPTTNIRAKRFCSQKRLIKTSVMAVFAGVMTISFTQPFDSTV